MAGQIGLITTPTPQEWSALYHAAIDFKKLACWEWMYDSDLFGVQNPDDGQIGYCCVMGNLGEHFALGVYLGSEGLEGYLKIQSGELQAPDMAMLHYQKCLMASFEDRDYLEKQDLSIIKQLGLKFRGRNAWPSFRSFRPGYLPWFLTADEARFLTIALQQTIDVATRFRDDQDLLAPPRKGLYLVRVPTRSGADLAWTDQWLAPKPLNRKTSAIPQVDEVHIQRIKRAITARQGVWEGDFFFSPAPVQGEERPYFPYMFLWADRRSGMILHSHLAEPANYRAEFQGQFITLIERSHMLPKEIHLRQQEAVDLLDPITSRLGIKLKRSKRLGMLEAAQASMISYFQRF